MQGLASTTLQALTSTTKRCQALLVLKEDFAWGVQSYTEAYTA